MSVHDIIDGSELVDPFVHESDRIWREENGVNILGTPLGSSSFVSGYLRGQGPQTSSSPALHQGRSGSGISTGGRLDAQRCCSASPFPHSEIGAEEQPYCGMDGGDGRSSPLSLASLPPYFGGLGKRPGCGGKRASIGAFGFASLLWEGGGLDYNLWFRPWTRSTWDLSRG